MAMVSLDVPHVDVVKGANIIGSVTLISDPGYPLFKVQLLEISADNTPPRRFR